MNAQKPAMQALGRLAVARGATVGVAGAALIQAGAFFLLRLACAHRLDELLCCVLGEVAAATTAIDAAGAGVAVALARIERCERTVVARAELLPGQIERGMARIARVLAVGTNIDRRAPQLALDAEVSVLSAPV
jgi:hypothetical protein